MVEQRSGGLAGPDRTTGLITQKTPEPILRNFAAYLTQTAGSDRLQSSTVGHHKIAPATCPRRSQGKYQGVAGQEFEPWKASADGFTVRSYTISAGDGAVYEQVLT
jgi:hypothetical protein